MPFPTTITDVAGGTTPGIELPPEQWEFSVVLRPHDGGAELVREKVPDADLLDLQCELWRDGCLRKGRPDIGLDDLQFRLRVQREQGDTSRCTGLQLGMQSSCGSSCQREFETSVFGDIAARLRQRLINDKVLKLDELIVYEVHASQRSETDAVSDDSTVGTWTLEGDKRASEYTTWPLPPLLARARSVGEVDDEFPVIYTEDALVQAERFARRGAAASPPSESGGVLIGPLCSCPETGEWFVVVCQVLEVRDAEEATFSLSYTNKSWIRIQNIVQAMRSQPDTRAHRIVGQCHGHNFPPAGGAAPCEACATQKECHRRSDAASVDDRLWTQATFSRAPWALCHIFGINARGENVHSLFTLKGNQLQPRGFHVISEFDPLSRDATRPTGATLQAGSRSDH